MWIVSSFLYFGIERSTEASSEYDREEPVLVKPHHGFHQRLAGQLLHNWIWRWWTTVSLFSQNCFQCINIAKYWWMKPKQIILLMRLFILMVKLNMAARLVLQLKKKQHLLPGPFWPTLDFVCYSSVSAHYDRQDAISMYTQARMATQGWCLNAEMGGLVFLRWQAFQ